MDFEPSSVTNKEPSFATATQRSRPYTRDHMLVRLFACIALMGRRASLDGSGMRTERREASLTHHLLIPSHTSWSIRACAQTATLWSAPSNAPGMAHRRHLPPNGNVAPTRT